MEGAFLPDVPILELFASENETPLVWRGAFFVSNLGLDVLNGANS